MEDMPFLLFTPRGVMTNWFVGFKEEGTNLVPGHTVSTDPFNSSDLATVLIDKFSRDLLTPILPEGIPNMLR